MASIEFFQQIHQHLLELTLLNLNLLGRVLAIDIDLDASFANRIVLQFDRAQDCLMQVDSFPRHTGLIRGFLRPDNINDMRDSLIDALKCLDHLFILIGKVCGERDHEWEYLLPFRVIFNEINPILLMCLNHMGECGEAVYQFDSPLYSLGGTLMPTVTLLMALPILWRMVSTISNRPLCECLGQRFFGDHPMRHIAEHCHPLLCQCPFRPVSVSH